MLRVATHSIPAMNEMSDVAYLRSVFFLELSCCRPYTVHVIMRHLVQ